MPLVFVDASCCFQCAISGFRQHCINDFIHIIYPSTTYIDDIRCMWICRRVHHDPKFVYDILKYLEVISIRFQCGIMNVCTNEWQPTELGMLCSPQWMNGLVVSRVLEVLAIKPGDSVCEGHSHPLGQFFANSGAWGILAFGLQSLCPCPRHELA